MQIYVRATQFAEQTVRVQNSMPRRRRSKTAGDSWLQSDRAESELDVRC